MSLRLFLRHWLLPSALIVILSVMLCGHADASPWQDEFEIGDTVEFKFLGDVVQGEVVGFTGTGWPTMQFLHNGRTHERFFPPSRLTLVEGVDEEEVLDEMPPVQNVRNWTDTTGKFTVTARLLSNQNGQVELEKEDGRVVSLAQSKLSEPDQAYLNDLKNQESEDNPFAGGEKKTNRESPKTGRRRNRGAASRNPSPRSMPAINPAFFSNEIVLSVQGWNVEPDAAQSATPSARVINVRSGFTEHAFHNRLGGAALSTDKRWVAIVHTNPFENDSEVVVADTETGETRPALRTGSKDASLLAVSPDGARVVTVIKGSGREPGKLEFWNVDGSANTIAPWNTSSFFERDGFAPTAGRFLDESRLLTIGRRVILWDCETAAAKYSLFVSSNCQPAVSANAKQVAVIFGESVFIVDANNGKSLGKFRPPSAANAMAFSANGNLLAGIDGRSGSIWVWDLVANKLARQMSAPPPTVKTLDFIGDKYLLINDSILLDIELRTTVWRYRVSGGSVLSADDGRFWFVGKSKLTPISLPHMDLESQTDKFDPDALLVTEPGSELALDFELPFPPADQASIRTQVVEMLQANNIAIRDGAELKLSLSITKGKQETAEMSSIMDPFGRRGTESITFTPNVGKVLLTKGSVTLWGRSRRFGPGGMINMKDGESAQAAANRLCQPDVNFFKAVKMPKFISQFPDGKPLGESTLSELGIR